MDLMHCPEFDNDSSHKTPWDKKTLNLTPKERALLDHYRHCDERGKRTIKSITVAESGAREREIEEKTA